MTKSLESKFSHLTDRRAQLVNEMFDCIEQAVQDEGSVSYTAFATADDWCGYDEIRWIRYDERNDLTIYDEDNYEIARVMDLGVDDLYDICIAINKEL